MTNARDIVGDEALDDYILRPEIHADQLPMEAGALARILRSDAIKEVIRNYRVSDHRALRFQRWYKRLGGAAIVFQAIGALVGALFLVVNFSSYAPNWAQRANFIELFALLVAISVGGMTAIFDVYRKWNQARAAAEIARVEFFHRLVSASVQVVSSELPVLPFQLEYFRRYQLQIQKAYYRQRGSEHLLAYRVQQAISVGLAIATAFLLLVAANGLFRLGLDFGEVGHWLTARTEHNVFAGLLLGTFSVLLMNWSLLSQSENNAKRYAATLANLEQAESEYLESAREAAEAGDKEGVVGFVDWINQFVSIEHRQWVVLQDFAARPDFGPLGTFRLPKLRRRTEARRPDQ